VTVAGALIVNFWSVNPFVGILFTMIAFAVVAWAVLEACRAPSSQAGGGAHHGDPGIWDFSRI